MKLIIVSILFSCSVIPITAADSPSLSDAVQEYLNRVNNIKLEMNLQMDRERSRLGEMLTKSICDAIDAKDYSRAKTLTLQLRDFLKEVPPVDYRSLKIDEKVVTKNAAIEAQGAKAISTPWGTTIKLNKASETFVSELDDCHNFFIIRAYKVLESEQAAKEKKTKFTQKDAAKYECTDEGDQAFRLIGAPRNDSEKAQGLILGAMFAQTIQQTKDKLSTETDPAKKVKLEEDIASSEAMLSLAGRILLYVKGKDVYNAALRKYTRTLPP